jgi:hypothetical protein
MSRFDEMEESWPSRICGCIMENIVFLPLKMADRSASPLRRVLWTVLFFFSFVPAMGLATPIVLPCMFADILVSTWKGNK